MPQAKRLAGLKGIMESILSNNVLVLNRLWQAVNICSVKRAFMLLYQGHAQVVEGRQRLLPDDDVRPVVQLFARLRRRGCGQHHLVQDSRAQGHPAALLRSHAEEGSEIHRHNIFERDHNTCQYCGHKFDRKDLNLDHVIPRDRGGETSWENIVCSCVPCNSRKGNRTPHEAGLRLLHKPRRPKWRPMLHLQFSRARDDSWKHFVDLAYWNVELTD